MHCCAIVAGAGSQDSVIPKSCFARSAGRTLRVVSAARKSTLAILSLVALVARAEASELAYHLDGQVTRIMGSSQSALAQLGVHVGVSVSIDWTVESTTPVASESPPNFTKTYRNALTSFKIQVGSWIAQGADPPGLPDNRVVIRDGPPANPQENMDLFRSGADTGSLLSATNPNGAELILHLFDPAGGASTSNSLGDQTPSLYPSMSGTVAGDGGEVDFSLPVASAPPPDPTVKCRSAQIAAAGVLCKATFACLATHANSPAKDPSDTKLDACRDKARSKFAAAFDKAAAVAAAQGLSCGTTLSAETLTSDFDAGVDDVVAVVATSQPEVPQVISSWYAGAGVMCGVVAKAVSKNLPKPAPDRLAQLRASARDKLSVAASKVIAKAQAKGVTFDPPPDVQALIDSVDALIDDLVAALNGS
jgi:hypothetical protein